MFTRYPHTATIKVKVENVSNDGIPTITDSDIIIKGRYEPSGQNKALDYSAKFFCKYVSVSGFSIDGQPLIYNGKQFKIVQLFNYQMHCEIWLE